MTDPFRCNRRPARRTTGARPAVAPIARAIRTALTVSTLALSLAAHATPANPSLPTGCAPAAARACDAGSGEPLRHDPSLVADRFVPAAVHAVGDGLAGTTVIVHDLVTDVVADDAIGLGAADDIVDLRNTGTIGAHGVFSAIGIDVFGTDLTVVNDGGIVADAVNAGVYGYAPAIGIRAFGDEVHITNGPAGTIGVEADASGGDGRARARGVYAVAFGGDVVVDNQGAIDALAVAEDGRAEAHGIYAFGYGGPTTVVNAGDIASHAVAGDGRAYATGINAIGYGSGDGVSSVVNTGDIDALAEGDRAYAFGILNLTRQSGGSAYTDNAGDVHAEAIGDAATVNAVINLALRYGDATLVNSGTVDAIADGDRYAAATGLYNHAYVYGSALDNRGTVNAEASADLAVAVGLYGASGIYGDSSVYNAGAVTATATGGADQARAAGVVATSEHGTSLVNHGDVAASASSAEGVTIAVGLYARGTETVSIDNVADVAAVATTDDGSAYAYGAMVIAGYTGIGVLVNGGDLSADATATGGTAYAVGGLVSAEVGSIFNDGATAANAVATGGDAIARGARVYSMYGLVENTGTLDAGAIAEGGDALAIGADAFGYFGAAVANGGDIDALAVATGGDATATGAYTLGMIASAYTENTGTISAGAHSDAAAVANGVITASLYYGHAVTVNHGDVSALAVGGLAEYGEVDALAFGIYNFALLYSSVVDNTGTVVASAQALADIDPTEGLVQAQALGVAVINRYGVFDAAVYNAGTIRASAEVGTGLATSWGVAAQSTGLYGGNTVVDNDGTISAYAHADIGVAETAGVYAANLSGDTSVVNHGDIVAVADTQRGVVNTIVNYAYATGVAVSTLYGDATLDNHGDITAVARSYGGINGAIGAAVQGSTAIVRNAEGATITAIGESERFGLGGATGAIVSGTYYAGFVNDGTVIVHGSASAFLESEDQGFYGAASVMGIGAIANLQGDATIVNHGDLLVSAVATDAWTQLQGGAGAVGAHAYAKYDAVIENTGRIVVTADTEVGIASAYGAVGEGKYRTEIVNQGDILVSATAGSLDGDLYGGRAVAMGAKVFHSDHAAIVNDGTISVQALVDADSANPGAPTIAMSWGASIGYNTTVLDGIIDNRGTVESVARADHGYATAYGLFVNTIYDSAIVNGGDVLASATAVQGDAWAVGALGYGLASEYVVPCDDSGCHYDQSYFVPFDGVAHLDNTGTIAAIADAEGGIATAYGVAQLGAFGTGIVNGGDIVAIAGADEARAVGALGNSFYAVTTVDNAGTIAAEATGATAEAIGVYALGLDGVTVDNAGTIVAGAYGADAVATAVALDSDGVNTLHNTGTLAALGDGERFAIRSGAGAIADLRNDGTMLGAIATGDLADTLANGGTWFALGTSSFGAGADVVGNTGLVVFDDATMAFGGDAGDTFANTGGVVMRGDGNLVDIGPGLFTNDGWISLVDGATGDALGIVGTVAGSGSIALDVDAQAGTADTVAIAGDVDAAAVQTLDVNLLARPESEDFEIALVTVTGDSTAGNFALGDVAYAAGFVTLDFGLHAAIDAAGDDVFSLGVSVDGLSAGGKLATALSPGVQTLVDAQVGTWRQRMGVLPRTSSGGPDAWVRAFSSNGDLDVAHAGIGADSRVAIDQSSHGWELGVDLALNEHVSVGLLAGEAEATSRVADAGSNRLDATTFGLYATWQGADGLYVDVSQRWTGVDVELRGPADTLRTEVDADTFNVEAGFAAWTVGGVGITPQLQYTRTRIGDVSPVHAGPSVYEDDGGVSSRGRIGVMFDRTFASGGFLLTPYASLNAVREFDGAYDHTINGGVTGTSTIDGTAALVELGLGARNGGLSVTGGVSWTDGGAQDGVAGAQLNLRYAW